MKEMNVYDFCNRFYKGQEIRLHVWVFTNDTEECEHKTYTDKFDHDLYHYRDTEVIQFNCPKRNVIEIIACRDLRTNKES